MNEPIKIPVTQSMIDDCPFIFTFHDDGSVTEEWNPHLSPEARAMYEIGPIPPTTSQRFKAWLRMWKWRFVRAWESLRGIEPEED